MDDTRISIRDLEREERLAWFGPETRNVLIAQIRRMQPNFDIEAALQALPVYNSQCWRLCHIADELARTCTHPELIESMAPLPESGMQYQCSRCRKKVIVPPGVFLSPANAKDADEAIAGIIGLAFGEHWKQNLKRN